MLKHDPAYRITSDLLCLWALCAKPACRRAKACKDNPKACVARCGPLVPEDARCGALALVKGGQDGVGIDEVRRYVPRDIAALEAWTAQVHASGGQARETCDHAGAFGS